MGDALPRLLVVMGSGETSPTMVKVHRDVFARLEASNPGGPVPAVLLDTPFGFQENADDIASKAVTYFKESVGRTVDVASLRTPDADALTIETMLSQVRTAAWTFAGPGSPSYALRVWRGSPLPGLLADKLARGGCVTFASAAALTLGVVTVPVYEIYKVGADPAWLDGLDLLGAAGLEVALIPHYDNAEGGNHDTRFCYLGERRLSRLERDLPDGAFVLGVDEHTGLILDLGAGLATVVGRGVVTVRRRGRSIEIPTGETLAISDLPAMAAGRTTPGGAATASDSAAGSAPTPAESSAVDLPATSLLEETNRCQADFDAALGQRSVPAAVKAILELDGAIVAWSRDTLQSDEADKARATLRGMVVRLGQLAEVGAVDRRDVVGPFVDTLLDVRRRARADKRWADADAVRDRLVDLGVEVRDTPSGSEWDLDSA